MLMTLYVISLLFFLTHFRFLKDLSNISKLTASSLSAFIFEKFNP